MGRTRDELMRDLPPARQAKVAARTQELVAEVHSLHELRRLAERSQAQIAAALGVKQPSVHKIERQTDLYLSTLRRFVEAAGGTLELRVALPGRDPLRLAGVGDLREAAEPAAPAKRTVAARVAEERLGYTAATEASAEGASAGTKVRRHRGRLLWKAPKVRRMKAGEAETKAWRGEPALQAS
jgi:predicted XRE-type DNA-binding protein